MIKRTVEYIDLNLSQDLTISLLAQKAGISKAYLSKRFHQETGTTIG